MQPTLTLSLATSQVLHVHMSEPLERLTYEALAKHQLALDHEAAELRKTYHMGDKPTPGRGYDDRLTVRLGPCRATLQADAALWAEYGGRRGGLPHTRKGNKYWVCEADCREYAKAKKAAKS